MERQYINYISSDEIDLKKYIKVVLSYWIWIVAASILVGGSTFLYASRQAPTYTATALVSVSAPSLNVEFDTSIRTSNELPVNLQNNDLPDLALSDEVVLNLFNNVQAELPMTVQNQVDLRDSLDATTEPRSQIVLLKGTFSDPEVSALVVSEWSNVFVEATNLFFEGSRENSQAFLQEQLALTQIERDAINQEFVDFQSRNTIQILRIKLDSDNDLQKSYITKRNSLSVLLYDIEGIKKQIVEDPTNISVLNDLALYALQNRAFNTSSNIRIDVTSFDSISNSTFENRVDQLNSLELAIQSQQSEIDSKISDLEPLILSYQQQIEALTVEKADITSRKVVILNAYDSLARKVSEAGIEQNNISGKAQIASRAIVPIRANPRGQLTTSALAVSVVAMLFVGLVLIREWWNDQRGFDQLAHDVFEESNIASHTNSDSNGYAPQQIKNDNGNGARPTKKEEFLAND